MAHNDREIEVKFPLAAEQLFAVRQKLKGIARFAGKTAQSDEYFTPAHRNFAAPSNPFEWMSLRRRAGKALLNYKHFHPEGADAFTHCDEFETVVERHEQLQKILSALDMRSLVTVEKERESYQYKDKFEIALDTVRELGSYMEIEAIKDLGSVEETREKILSFAKDLGMDVSQKETRGYPFMLMKKKGSIR